VRSQPDRFVTIWFDHRQTAGECLAACRFERSAFAGALGDGIKAEGAICGGSSEPHALSRLLEREQVVLFDRGRADLALRKCPGLSFLSPILRRAVDVLDLALLAVPDAPTHSFSAVCIAIGVPPPPPDASAEAAARAVGELLVALKRRLGQAPMPVLAEILRLTAGMPWPARAVLNQVVTKRSRADAPEVLDLGTVLRRRSRKAARPRPESPPAPLEANAILGIFSPDGPLAACHPTYERRPGQLDMAEAVTRAFNDQEILLVEAGTGTGKSLAYLVPAVHWATSRREAVLVSTNTKNLQEQLAKRDVPLLQRCLDTPFSAVVMKGRANYACVRKLVALRDDADQNLFAGERVGIAFLIRWVTDSQTGDLSELSGEALEHLPALTHLVDQIRSDTEACAGGACPWRGACFVERIRTAAREADVVIVNHALVLAQLEAPIFPVYECIVVDEAHNLEDVATDQFGVEVTGRLLRQLARLLVGVRTRPGFLDRLQAKLERADLADPGGLPGLLEAAERVAHSFDEVSDDLGAALHALQAALQPDTGRRTETPTVRITGRVREKPQWLNVALAVENLAARAGAMSETLYDLGAAVGEVPSEALPDAEGLKRDLFSYAGRWRQVATGLARVLEGAEGHVSWFEAGGRRDWWALHCVPIHVGELLRERLWDCKRTVIVTSATLTADGTFQHIRQRLGLDAVGHRVTEAVVPSPFDYQNQLLMCIPSDSPLPDDPAYAPAAGQAIAALAAAAGGRTLALFTSNASLQQTCDQVEPQLACEGIAVLCQGRDGPRHALIERLRTEDRVVVLGTKSFWEGVDVPGEALECLVIARLPFPVPTDPVIEARSEHLRSLGVDAMRLYYIPQAIMGFKQGVGRLIRSSADRGVVLVLDKRLLLREYGARFLRSIPQARLVSGPLDDLLTEAALWLRRPPREGS
jgi:predicted DnaQ family exonuclease/DinG family helicase